MAGQLRAAVAGALRLQLPPPCSLGEPPYASARPPPARSKSFLSLFTRKALSTYVELQVWRSWSMHAVHAAARGKGRELVFDVVLSGACSACAQCRAAMCMRAVHAEVWGAREGCGRGM